MIVQVMAISNLVLTRQIYSEQTNRSHAHYREPVPLTIKVSLPLKLHWLAAEGEAIGMHQIIVILSFGL